MKRYLLLTLFGFIGLSSFGQRTIKMVVSEESKPCRRMMEMTCLQVQMDGSKTWELFYERIKGFEYEEGYRYVIEVIETPRPEPVPQDLSKNTYSLSKIISKTLVLVDENILQYQMIRLNGSELAADVYSIYFDTTLTKLSGFSGCNNYSIPVKWNSKKTKVSMGEVSATKVFCGDDASKNEQNLFQSLANKKFKVKKTESEFIFTVKGKEVFALAIRSKMPPPEASYRPPRGPWNLVKNKTLNLIQLDGETQKKVIANISFDVDNGTFSGSNGCNRMNGNFSVKGNLISFMNIVTTKMACDGVPGQTEKRVMEILRMKDLHYDFAETVLNIYNSEGNLLLMFGVATEK